MLNRLCMFSLCLTALVVAACATPTANTPKPVAVASPARPTPAAGGNGILPAPLYFISANDSQVWRLERDGKTLKQISHESVPVIDLDVSPTDGALAYISDNKLIRCDAAGGSRTVLVNGPALVPGDRKSYIMDTLATPRWSPDGTRLAYGLNGVNLIPAGGGEAQVLQASDPVPDPQAMPNAPVRFYQPNAWSPDGTRLLLDFLYFLEGGGLAIKTLSDGALMPLTNGENMVCCYPTWGTDSQNIYFANNSVSITPGFWRAPVSSGEASTLIAGQVGETYNLIAHPHQAPDGQLYFFMAVGLTDPAWPPALIMYRSGPDGVSGQKTLRTEPHTVIDALWAKDGSGAVILEVSEMQPPLRGPLVWLPATGGPAVTLPATGEEMSANLRWGQ